MRRREKFVISSILLSLGLLLVQFTSLEYRYIAIFSFSFITYLISAWALIDDLQPFEWATILPSTALYAGGVGLFYFLLPENTYSRLFILSMFGIGMYGLFLSSNILSVAKAKTIQLIHAALAFGLLMTLLTSLLFTNTIFSLRWPFYVNSLLVGLVHFPLIFMSLWSVNLKPKIEREELFLAGLMTLSLMEIALVLSFFPISVWNISLFIMAMLYLGLGVLHNYLRGVLFDNIVREYSLVGGFVIVVFFMLFSFK